MAYTNFLWFLLYFSFDLCLPNRLNPNFAVGYTVALFTYESPIGGNLWVWPHVEAVLFNALTRSPSPTDVSEIYLLYLHFAFRNDCHFPDH